MSNSPKIALITGASRGLGRNMAIILARKGVDVIGTDHSNKAEAAAVTKLVEPPALLQQAGFLRVCDDERRHRGDDPLPRQGTGRAADRGEHHRAGCDRDGFRRRRRARNQAANKRVAANTALGRASLPDDIGPAVAALLSGDNRRVNGQRIGVSGGMVL